MRYYNILNESFKKLYEEQEGRKNFDSLGFNFGLEPFYEYDELIGFKLIITDSAQKKKVVKHLKDIGVAPKKFFYEDRWVIEYDIQSKLFSALIPEVYRKGKSQDIIWTPYPLREQEVISLLNIDMDKLITAAKQNKEEITEDVNLPENPDFEVLDDEVGLEEVSDEDISRYAQTQELNLDELLDEFGDDLFGRYCALLDNIALEDIAYEVEPESIESSDRIKQRLEDKFSEYEQSRGGSVIYEMKAYEIEGDNRNMLSNEFIQACFKGDLFEFFYPYYDVDATDSDYYINEEVFKYLQQIGFNRDAPKKALSGKYTDEEPLSNYFDDLVYALSSATAEGLMIGGIDEAINSFNDVFERSLPAGTTWLKDLSDDTKRPIKIEKEFIFENLYSFWLNFGSLQYFDDAINTTFLEVFNYEFDFREPRYGFEGFSEEAFNSYLMEIALPELEIEINRDRKSRE